MVSHFDHTHSNLHPHAGLRKRCVQRQQQGASRGHHAFDFGRDSLARPTVLSVVPLLGWPAQGNRLAHSSLDPPPLCCEINDHELVASLQQRQIERGFVRDACHLRSARRTGASEKPPASCGSRPLAVGTEATPRPAPGHSCMPSLLLPRAAEVPHASHRHMSTWARKGAGRLPPCCTHPSAAWPPTPAAQVGLSSFRSCVLLPQNLFQVHAPGLGVTRGFVQ